jgi:hypothetical protein
MVTLTVQIRVTDERWIRLLSRLREGECTVDDLAEIRKLVLTLNDEDVMDLTASPWSDAVLATPRHAVRTRRNNAMLQKHCVRTGHGRYVVLAEDTIGVERTALSIIDRVSAAR